MHASTPPLQTRSLRPFLRLLALVAMVATAWTSTTSPARAAAQRTIQVRPGTGTISAAVASARPGDTIALAPGTYRDSVFVPISLRIVGAGSSTVIRPSQRPDNPCDVTAADGICVAGARDSDGNPDPSKPVTDVTIADLRVTGFSGSGIFGIDTQRLRVHDVRADHNGEYGIARFVSTGTVFARNHASYNGEAGLYLGDSPDAHSQVRHNSADHNGFGIFLRDSTGIVASDNMVSHNCVGIFALNSGHGAPGDRPAGRYRIFANIAWANDRACPAGEHPPFSGVGIALFGVHDSRVRDNIVVGNYPTGASAASGGIVLVSSRFIGGADPSNNTIRDNQVLGNTPADITYDGTGIGNKIVDNEVTGN